MVENSDFLGFWARKLSRTFGEFLVDILSKKE
jgi:hypothetical protein